MNSSNFFLSELEELKSCIYRVETETDGMGFSWRWHHLLVLLFQKTVLLASERAQNTICDKSLQSLSNDHSEYCRVAYLYWQKFHWEELERSQRKIRHGTDT